LPVLVAATVDDKETMPRDKIPLGVIYRALKTITAANRRVNPELRRVIVVNHSICDVYAPFVRRASPWATLLDYFSHEHNLLFVVSAGNIFSKFPVATFRDIAAYEAADQDTREAAVLGAIEMAKATRTILSPAESVNALTVGAVHADYAEPDHTAPPDPYPTFAMSSLASAVGLGLNRSVKPDFLESGGRFAAGMTDVRGGSLEIHARASIHYGQQVAAPSITGQLNHRRLTSGTSNAAALTTRAAHFLADALDDLYADDDQSWHELKTRAVMLKTLLAHSASWGEVGERLDGAYPPRDPKKWSPRRNAITQFLGYGQLNISRVVSGAANRITLLAQDLTRGALLKRILMQLDAAVGTDYFSQYERVVNIDTLLVTVAKLLVAHRVALLVIDEKQSQNFLESPWQLQFVIFYLSLMNLGVSVLLLGNPIAFEHLKSFSQVMRRFSVGGNFDLNPAMSDENWWRKDFVPNMREFCVVEEISIEEQSLVQRIDEACAGFPGLCEAFYTEAQRSALRRPGTHAVLTPADFDEATRSPRYRKNLEIAASVRLGTGTYADVPDASTIPGRKASEPSNVITRPAADVVASLLARYKAEQTRLTNSVVKKMRALEGLGEDDLRMLGASEEMLAKLIAGSPFATQAPKAKRASRKVSEAT
jgi:hypothetical protein